MKPDTFIDRRRASIRLTTLATALTALLLSACANSPGAIAEGGRLAQLDQVLQLASSHSTVALEAVNPQVQVGQTVSLRVGSARPGYLYLFHFGTNGKDLSLSFPNAMDGANHMSGGTGAVLLPRPNWRLSAKGPAGTGYFLAVVADRQQDLLRMAGDVNQGRIALDGPYGAAMVTLREVAP